MTITFLDPTSVVGGRSGPAATGLAPIGDLSGRSVALVDNGKHNAGFLLAAVGRLVVERLGARVVDHRKQHPSEPIAPEVADELARSCDLVVTALGDCGSCSSWSCRDAIEFERRGTPAVLLCSEVFEPLVRSVASGLRVAVPRLVVLPHPIGGVPEADLEQRGVPALATRRLAEHILAPAGGSR